MVNEDAATPGSAYGNATNRRIQQVFYASSTAPDSGLGSVSGGGFQPPSPTNTFTYTYIQNSALVYQVIGPAHTVTNTWELDRDVLDVKENKAGSTVISRFDYTVNAIGQRTALSQTGSAFASVRGIAWGYDNYGQVTTADSTVTGQDRAYQYDAIGNRKKSAATLTLPVTDNYTANALNQYSAIQEGGTGVPPVLKKTRLWGTDLSGTLQGAGGVGGLLSESSQITSNPVTFNSYYPTYDGNGNVSEYLSSTGTIAAHFEYDPFGSTVVNTDVANQFTYRFITKLQDADTGLIYYGYRFYNSVTARWLSRDPLEESGGLNIYGFVGNNGIVSIDVLGFFPINVDVNSDWFNRLPDHIQRDLIDNYLGHDLDSAPRKVRIFLRILPEPLRGYRE